VGIPLGWIGYTLAWCAAALFWSIAAATGIGRSPIEALPFGALAMGSAGVMGVGVWWLAGRLPWGSNRPRFYAVHGAALVAFSLLYTSSSFWIDVAGGRIAEAIAAARSSPILVWSLLMGTWLYLLIAGLSYAIRTDRSMRAQEAAAAEARVLAQQAQLAALRAQVNPHFLFNALHTVGALVSIDPARADQALEMLGDLLRYVLDSEDEVAFAQEWRFTQHYLGFEQLRLGERLRVDMQADDEAFDMMVPPLILQPLVENAVRHGIADRSEGGRVDLSARIERGQLVLRVKDDGPAAAPPATESGAGLGLRSIRRRLAALYGERAFVEAGASGDGFTATIALPVDRQARRGSAA
jgi:hypothetical protein